MKLKYISYSLNVLLILFLVVLVIIAFNIGLIPTSNDSESTVNLEVFDSELSDINSYNVEVVAENLEIPWAVGHLNEEHKLVTERTGQVKLISTVNNEVKTIYSIPNVVAQGEAGLMSLALHPNFNENQYVYLYFSYSNEQGSTYLKVSRFEYRNQSLVNEMIIIDEIPYGAFHAGGELKFGPDGKLYITTGDVTDKNLAQDPNSIAGKTLRLNDNGSIPWDNPFVKNDEVLGEIYTLGHRNAQGISWHPTTLIQYQTDHGPSSFDGGTGMDEINLIKRGANYGWPTIRGEETQEGLESPIALYTPAIAPSSLEFYDREMFPELRGMLLVAALKGENIVILNVKNDEVIEQSKLFDEDNSYGRIRDISFADDGSIYFTTSNTDGRGTVRDNDDKVYRIYR